MGALLGAVVVLLTSGRVRHRVVAGLPAVVAALAPLLPALLSLTHAAGGRPQGR